MSKRRTRKQKEEAKHSYTYSWNPNPSEAKNRQGEASVKGQMKVGSDAQGGEPNANENAKNMGYIQDLASNKKGIYRSLLMAGVILASELVIYLVWNAK